MEALDEYEPLVIYAAYLYAADEPSRAALENYLKHWRKIHPLINGDDLRRRGLPPSPVYKQVLGTLRKAWLEGRVHNAAEEQVLLEEILR